MSYQVRDYTLPPGQTVTINIVGSECAVYEATKDFLLSHDALDPQFITGGMKLKPKNGFESIVMLNPHDEPVTVKLGITDGQIEDSRLSTSAPVQVSEIQTTVRVADPYNGSSFSGVITQLGVANSIGANVERRMRETTLDGYFYNNFAPKHKIGTSRHSSAVSTTVITIVDPASNTNGLIIREMHSTRSGNSGLVVYTGGDVPGGYVDHSKPILWFSGKAAGAENTFDPIFLQAGNGLFAAASEAGDNFAVSWDYL